MSVQPGLGGSNDLRVGRKMVTFQLFFQSDRAKDLKVTSNDLRYWVYAGRDPFSFSWLLYSRWLCLNNRLQLLYRAHERFYGVQLQPWHLFQCKGALATFTANSTLRVWNEAVAVNCTEQNPSEAYSHSASRDCTHPHCFVTGYTHNGPPPIPTLIHLTLFNSTLPILILSSHLQLGLPRYIFWFS